MQSYMSKCNTLPNLQLITDSENLSEDTPRLLRDGFKHETPLFAADT